MSDIAIRVEHLSKRYRLGEREPYKSLRDVIARTAATPLDWMRRNGQLAAGNELGYFWALDDVSFEIKHGEAVGIIGRNGAGKSTLLKILSRITKPTRGQAQIYGRVGSLLEVGTGFHPELTGRENIYLNGAILGMKKAEIKSKFDEIVDFAEVEKFIDTPVKRYSSGMYVRLAFAVAAHLEPEILLVDEVLAVGDIHFQNKCLGKMGDVSRQGRTILFVSHNMAAIEQLCPRGILLSDGHIEFSDSVTSVIKHYLSSNFTAGNTTRTSIATSSDGNLELISICPVDDHGQALSAAQCGHVLNLLLVVKANFPFTKVKVSIGINNLHGIRVTTLHSGISGQELLLKAGMNKIFCRVPDLSISSGNYTIDAKIIAGGNVVVWAPQVERIVIEAGDFFHTGKLPDVSWGGIFYLHQEWEADRDE